MDIGVVTAALGDHCACRRRRRRWVRGRWVNEEVEVVVVVKEVKEVVVVDKEVGVVVV